MSDSTGRAWRYTAGASVIGATVALLGWRIAGDRSLIEVMGGSGVAVVVQVAIFWTLFVWAFPDRQGLAYGLGVAVRLGAVATMAFLGVARLGLEAAPTLLSMVTCLFASTVLEAFFLQRRPVAGVGAVH
jgi:hypothetical protein